MTSANVIYPLQHSLHGVEYSSDWDNTSVISTPVAQGTFNHFYWKGHLFYFKTEANITTGTGGTTTMIHTGYTVNEGDPNYVVYVKNDSHDMYAVHILIHKNNAGAWIIFGGWTGASNSAAQCHAIHDTIDKFIAYGSHSPIKVREGNTVYTPTGHLFFMHWGDNNQLRDLTLVTKYNEESLYSKPWTSDTWYSIGALYTSSDPEVGDILSYNFDTSNNKLNFIALDNGIKLKDRWMYMKESNTDYYASYVIKSLPIEFSNIEYTTSGRDAFQAHPNGMPVDYKDSLIVNTKDVNTLSTINVSDVHLYIKQNAPLNPIFDPIKGMKLTYITTFSIERTESVSAKKYITLVVHDDKKPVFYYNATSTSAHLYLFKNYNNEWKFMVRDSAIGDYTVSELVENSQGKTITGWSGDVLSISSDDEIRNGVVIPSNKEYFVYDLLAERTKDMKSLSLFPGESVSVDDSIAGEYDISLWYTHDYSPTYWKILTQNEQSVLIDNVAVIDIYPDGSAFPLEITRSNNKIIIKNTGENTVFVADIRLYSAMPEYSEINKHSKTPTFGFFQLANDANVGLAGNAITDTLSVFKKNADDTSYTRGNLECNELDAFIFKGDTIVARNELLTISGDIHLDSGDILVNQGDLTISKGDLTIENGDVTIREGSKLHFVAQPAAGYRGVTFDMHYGADTDESESGLWNEHIKMISGLSSVSGRGQEEFCRILRKNDGEGNERRTELYLNPTSDNGDGQCKKVWIGSDTTHAYAVFGDTIFRSNGRESIITGSLQVTSNVISNSYVKADTLLYAGTTDNGVCLWQNPSIDYFRGVISLNGDSDRNVRYGANYSPNYGMWMQNDNGWRVKITGYDGIDLLHKTDLSMRIWKYRDPATFPGTPYKAGFSLAASDDEQTVGGWGNISYNYNADSNIDGGYFNFDSSHNASVMQLWSNGSINLNGYAFMSGDWGYANHLWIGHTAHRDTKDAAGNPGGYTILTNPEGDSLLNCAPGRTTYIRVGNVDKIACGDGIVIKGNLSVTGSWVTTTHGTITSDDRLKLNEQVISDASTLLTKLRPQVYDKLTAIDGNVEDATFESGLIAQEIWYDCPELRHLVSVGSDGKPADDVVTSSDPAVDPDYSSWGTDVASVNYIGFIPYLIRGFQEHSDENAALKKENESMKAKTASLEARTASLEAQIALLMKAVGLVDSGNVDV